MATSDVKADGAVTVTVLVSRRVKPTHEAAFEQASEAMTGAAWPFAGYLGGQMVRPDAQADEVEINLYHTVFAFDTPEHLQAWQTSSERHECLKAIAPHQPPPRWKMAVVTWPSIFSTVFVLFLILAPLLDDWPLLPRVMVITLLVVELMTWVVAPRLTTWLKPFFYPKPQAAG